MRASLSVDLDNLWSYQKVHGDPQWDRYASYLDVVVPRVLDVFGSAGTKITVFVVGIDASRPENRAALASLAPAGHEIGNHSYRHEPWLHRYSRDELAQELDQAETAIQRATGQRPIGFRGPGYSLSVATLEELARRGYRYDASLLPTWIGPLARRYYFRAAGFDAEQRRQRQALFGSWGDARLPLQPFRWQTDAGSLVELPVTTLPLLRIPIHASYLLYLAGVSPALAEGYFRASLALCRARKVEPSLLFHPLDFLGADDVKGLGFFPAMSQNGAPKLRLVRRWVQRLADHFDTMTMAEHVQALSAGERLRECSPEATPVGVRAGRTKVAVP